MGHIRHLRLLALASLFLLAVAACGGGGKSSKSEGTRTTMAGMQVEVHGTKDVSGETGKVEIELYDSYFEPTILKGKPGQKVTLELKNEGKMAHTFTLEDNNADQVVQPGDEAEVHVNIPQVGELRFVCRFHRTAGMIGALVASS